MTQPQRIQHLFSGNQAILIAILLIFSPVILNYPPNDTSKFIRKYYISTTFLEEYVYPLHGSVYVNGYEPYIESELLKKPHSSLGDRMQIGDKFFVSKATIRYMPNSWYIRILVYFGIWISIFGIIRVGRKVLVD